jgi:hypothetical protein
MTKEILSDEEISHPLNEALLKEAQEIKAERRLLKERLDRLEQGRESVSANVYQKVRGDYQARLNKTTERLLALKKDLEGEEKALVEKKNLVEVTVARRKETIEEARLRHSLEEYTAEQHQEVVERETNELKRLEAALQILEEGIERHRKIFEGEELAAPAPAKKPPRAAPSAPPPSPPPPSPPPTMPEEPAHDQTAKIKVKPPPPIATPEPEPRKTAELLIMENGKVVQMVPVDKTIQIGRSPANDIVLKEPKVSRKHAEIQFVGGKYVLLDLESSNGTFVSGKKITEYTLQPNDEIVIGNTKIVFKI